MQYENKKILLTRPITNMYVPKDNSTPKRLCYCFKDYLNSNIRKHKEMKHKPIRDLYAICRYRIIKSISHQVLAIVINNNLFEE